MNIHIFTLNFNVMYSCFSNISAPSQSARIRKFEHHLDPYLLTFIEDVSHEDTFPQKQKFVQLMTD